MVSSSKTLATGTGVGAMLLGCAVSLGWYTDNTTLIQVHSNLPPMEFNTALGLILGGLLLALPRTGPNPPRLAVAGLLTALGVATLAEYGFGVDSGLKQIFLHYVNAFPAISPRQMAPNTAFAFAFMGTSIGLCAVCSAPAAETLRATAGSILAGIAVFTLLSYWMGLGTTSPWGTSGRMALHTATGFSLLGTGMIASAWPVDRPRRLPNLRWLPAAAGIGILTVNVALWHALAPEQSLEARRLGNDLLLIFGIAFALIFSLAVAYAQRARTSKMTAQHARRMMQNEMQGRMRAEQAKRQSDAQLRQAQKLEAVGQLTGGIAHDFNNMLGIVSGNLELLESRLLAGGNAAEYLHKATQGVQRGAALTQKLLAFSRRQILQPRVMNINKTVEGMTELLRRTLGEAISVKTACDANLWRCQVDPPQLENALINLSLNARDAMPHGGTLIIETRNVHLGADYAKNHADVNVGKYVMLAVSDNGTGMSETTLNQVFEPFFTTKEASSGSGLGLSMVHGFIKQSGGLVNIYSEPGEGTSIKIYLPRTREQETEVLEHPETKNTAGGTETILVVEDEPDLLNVIREQLQSVGYRVFGARDGASALLVIADHPTIDMLLTDVVLPCGKTGRDVAAELLALRPGLKVLYMSGYTENAIVHHGRLDDDATMLAKPFTMTDLAHKIRTVLDG